MYANMTIVAANFSPTQVKMKLAWIYKNLINVMKKPPKNWLTTDKVVPIKKKCINRQPFWPKVFSISMLECRKMLRGWIIKMKKSLRLSSSRIMILIGFWVAGVTISAFWDSFFRSKEAFYTIWAKLERSKKVSMVTPGIQIPAWRSDERSVLWTTHVWQC